MPEFTGRLRTPRLTAAPTSPTVGEMYYDTALNKLFWWNGTGWLPATGGDIVYNGSFPLNTPYTPGDIVVQNGVAYMAVKATSATPTAWPGVAGVPQPVVNGQFLKGSGGSVIWSPITQADLGADTAWHVIGQAGQPAFTNSWANLGAPSSQPQARYRKLASGLVILSGVISGGTANTIAFTLPAGYRPVYGTGGSIQAWFVVQTNSATSVGSVLVRSDGAVLPNVGSAWWFLDNIAFFAEA